MGMYEDFFETFLLQSYIFISQNNSINFCSAVFFVSIFSAEAWNLIFHTSTLIILHSYIIIIIIIINNKNERVELIYLLSCVSNPMSPKVKVNNQLDESGDKSNAITNYESIHSLFPDGQRWSYNFIQYNGEFLTIFDIINHFGRNTQNFYSSLVQWNVRHWLLLYVNCRPRRYQGAQDWVL